MKKQGFTLIELMVVIVIMGILAAVAVPKLFAQIAKSKASEVGPAAGTYVHLQDAYFAEKSKFATFATINYEPPTSSVFTYTYEGNDDAETGTFNAATKQALGQCSGTFTVTSSIVSAKSNHVAATPGEECDKLTPNFSKIGASS